MKVEWTQGSREGLCSVGFRGEVRRHRRDGVQAAEGGGGTVQQGRKRVNLVGQRRRQRVRLKATLADVAERLLNGIGICGGPAGG